MINTSDVATGLLGLGVIAGAVGLVAIGGRDPRADEHTVADYRPVLHPSRREWPLGDRRGTGRRRLRARAMAGSLPIYAEIATEMGIWPVGAVSAEQVVAGVVRARYGTTDPAEVARRVLAELGEQARADLAVTR